MSEFENFEKKATRIHEGRQYEQPPEPLTVEKAGKLFFLSFRFSQGLSSLQSFLFSWLHQHNPHWHIDNESAKQIREQSFGRFKKFLSGNHTVLSTEQITDSLNVEVRNMQKILNRKTPSLVGNTSKSEETNKDIDIIPDITREILYRDGKYYDVGGRPGRFREHHGTPKPLEDRYLSHFCYYGLQGHPTGSAEFDQLFREVRDYVVRILQGEQKEPGMINDLNQVVTNYNMYHPDNTILIQNLLDKGVSASADTEVQDFR